MAYSSPHPVRHYLASVALLVNHEFCLRCQRRSTAGKRAILKATREIDICARIFNLIGPSCHLAAQGTSDFDLKNDGPTFRAEVKYLHPKRTNWDQVRKDWDWFLATSSNNKEFRKRGLLFFWPSTSLYDFTQCLSVPKGHGTRYARSDYAPFVHYAEPTMPDNGTNQLLQFKEPPAQSRLGIQVREGKRVRLDLVGAMTHPIWVAVYTRITPDEFTALQETHRVVADDDPIDV